jgi:acyl carrier protein
MPQVTIGVLVSQSSASQPSVTDLLAMVLDVDSSLLNNATKRDDLDEWDSLAQLGVVSALEEAYGVQLTSAQMKECVSVPEIKAVLAGFGVQAI